MKHSINLFFISLLLITSCDSSPVTEYVKLNPVIVYDDMETIMPGNFIVFNDYLAWTDPFNTDGYLHIIDLNNREEVANILKLGGGPYELQSPLLGSSRNKIVAFDINSNKIAELSYDSIYRNKFDSIQFSINTDTERILELIVLDDNEKIILSFEKEGYLHYNHNHFGDIPFKEETNNLFDILQGKIEYNFEKNYLVYSAFRFPYIAIYKLDNHQFTIFQQRKDKINYKYSNKEIKLDITKLGSIDLALSKDYIITIQRDYKTDTTEEHRMGRDFTLLPKTVFVYDYDLNLIKIIDLNIPILRITSNQNNNEVYAIVVNPDFQVVKFNIN